MCFAGPLNGYAWRAVMGGFLSHAVGRQSFIQTDLSIVDSTRPQKKKKIPHANRNMPRAKTREA